MCVLIKRRLAYVASSTYTHFISTCTLTCYRSTQQHNIEKATTTNLYLHLWKGQVVVFLTESVGSPEPSSLVRRFCLNSASVFVFAVFSSHYKAAGSSLCQPPRFSDQHQAGSVCVFTMHAHITSSRVAAGWHQQVRSHSSQNLFSGRRRGYGFWF